VTISTYAELKTAIANYSARADLTGRDDEFIDNVEAKFNRRLRLRQMEATATGNFVAGTATIALPTDFLEARSFTYDVATSAPIKLEFVTPEQGDAMEYGTNAPPRWFTYAGGVIRLYPTPDQAYAYTLRHYVKVPALTSMNTTNFLLTAWPDAYLYGCLVEACAFAGDDPRLPIWKQGFEEAIGEMKRADRLERFEAPTVQFDGELLDRRWGYRVLSDSY
jgi:hypothetical protein